MKAIHKQKRLKWAEEYMQIDFSTVLFTDECRATPDGPDGWVSISVNSLHRLRRQQGGEGVMYLDWHRWWYNGSVMESPRWR